MHRDMIQFWNTDANDTSRDILIRGNVLEAAEGVTHGIYMANEHRQADRRPRCFLQERHDREQHGQERPGLRHRGRRGRGGEDQQQHRASALGHRQLPSGVDIPVILVDKDAKTVSITGNTTHKTPEAVEALNNWQPDDYKPVGLDDREQQDRAARHERRLRRLQRRRRGAAAPRRVPAGGDGGADEFRYNGDEYRRQRSASPSRMSTSGKATASSSATSTKAPSITTPATTARGSMRTRPTSGSIPWSTSRRSSPRPRT